MGFLALSTEKHLPQSTLTGQFIYMTIFCIAFSSTTLGERGVRFPWNRYFFLCRAYLFQYQGKTTFSKDIQENYREGLDLDQRSRHFARIFPKYFQNLSTYRYLNMK
jgi:hypothetical protein